MCKVRLTRGTQAMRKGKEVLKLPSKSNAILN